MTRGDFKRGFRIEGEREGKGQGGQGDNHGGDEAGGIDCIHPHTMPMTRWGCPARMPPLGNLFPNERGVKGWKERHDAKGGGVPSFPLFSVSASKKMRPGPPLSLSLTRGRRLLEGKKGTLPPRTSCPRSGASKAKSSESRDRP